MSREYVRRSNKRSKKQSNKRSKSNKKYKGGMHPTPVPYIGSIQGKYMNLDGKQLVTNPAGGIA